MKQRLRNEPLDTITDIDSKRKAKKQQQPPKTSVYTGVPQEDVTIGDGQTGIVYYTIKFYESDERERLIDSFLPMMVFSVYDGIGSATGSQDNKYPDGANVTGVQNLNVEWSYRKNTDTQEWVFMIIIKNDTGASKDMSTWGQIDAYLTDDLTGAVSVTSEVV